MKRFTIIAIMALTCLSAGAQTREFVPEIVDIHGNVIGRGSASTSYNSNSSMGYATTYNCFYNYDRDCSVNYTVSINGGSVSVNGTTYSLRKLGTITNSGLVFDSYAYSSNDRMLCVSRETITITGTSRGTVTGYMLLVDGRTYIARRR